MKYIIIGAVAFAAAYFILSLIIRDKRASAVLKEKIHSSTTGAMHMTHEVCRFIFIADGEKMEFIVTPKEFAEHSEGESGILVYRGRRMIDFVTK